MINSNTDRRPVPRVVHADEAGELTDRLIESTFPRHAPVGAFHYHVVLFQVQRHSQLTHHTYYDMRRLLAQRIGDAPSETTIDLWLESPGGSADAAYKIFLDLRSRCSFLRVIVPDYAKSAATLLAMGADEIFMGPAAELGPLDAQIRHPNREDAMLSALDVADSLQYLTRTAVEMTLTGGAAILETTGLPRAEVLKDVMAFMAQMFRPVMEKIDPHEAHQAAQALRVAAHYAVRMMRERRGTDGVSASEEDYADLMAHLIGDYPSHGCIIDRKEARHLGLPVYDAEEHDSWHLVEATYWHLLGEGRDRILVFSDSDLRSSPESIDHMEGDNEQDA